MRVGVYAGDFAPEEGGGHSFVAAILEAFLASARDARHAFTLLAEPGAAAALAPRAAAAGVALKVLPARTRLGMGVAALRHHAPFAWLLRGQPGRVERASREAGLQFLWFVPGLAYDATDTPYLGTIWDFLHRQLPWFPEAAADGYWEHREMMYARFTRRAAHLLTGTEVGAAELQRLYQVPRERITVLPQPAPVVAAPPASPSNALASLAGRRFFLYPAQFWPHKNHVNLLQALARLEGGEELVLPGADKGNLAHVRAEAKRLGLEARVHFPGFVSPGDLAWLYRQAVALAYPSFLGPDNLPPLEAFAQGCPVALANYPGAEEQAGDASLRFDPADPEDLARTLRRLSDDAPLRETLIDRGRARALRWTAGDYVRGVYAVLDRFEAVRRTWP